MHTIPSKITELLRDFRKSWRPLLAIHILYTLLAVAILTPLITLSIHLLVELSGEAALSDQDILFFALTPMGFMAMIGGAALVVTATALEFAALMPLAYGAVYGHSISYGRALLFAIRRGGAALQLVARGLGRLLLYMLPFLGAIALIYVLLLSQYDINYYLSTTPPSFWLAAGLAGLVLAGMLAVLVRVFVSWFFALPLLLFQEVAPSSALLLSTRETSGKRRNLTVWVCIWFVASLAITAGTSAVVAGLGALIVPHVTASIQTLSIVLGALLLVGFLAQFAVFFFSIAMLSLLVVHLYREAGLGSETEAVSLRDMIGKAQRQKLIIGGRLILAVCVAGAAVAIGFSHHLITSLSLEDHAEIFAHRGSSAAAPENTMAAVRLAMADGTDWVEIDVQETADGEVVVLHDSDLKKVGGQNLKIWDATTETLQDIDIGSWFGPAFRGERVPTLQQVLETCRGHCGVNIELKYYGHDKQLEERVVEIVEAAGMSSNIVVMSLDYNGIQKIRSLRPKWTVGLLTSVTLGNTAKLDVDFFAINARFASRAFIESAHQNAQDVIVWTVNDRIGMSQMLSRGVDGIITDQPALGKEVLRERAALSTPERLLLELASLFGQVPEPAEQ